MPVFIIDTEDSPMSGYLLELMEEKQHTKQCPACLERVDEHATWCSFFFSGEGEEWDADEPLSAVEVL